MAKLIMAVRHEQILNIRLPGWRHQPGITEAADQMPLDQAKALVPEQFKENVPLSHPAFEYGLLLHDNGYFWEAHEVWEAIWIAAPKNGRDRITLKALIQIANAGLKAFQNKTVARNRLVDEALELLDELNIRKDLQVFSSPAHKLRSYQLIGALKEWRNGKEVTSQIQLNSFFSDIAHSEKAAK